MPEAHPDHTKDQADHVTTVSAASLPAPSDALGSESLPAAEPAPATSAVPMTNHFSCVNCRRHKIKCNKVDPCTNCTKAQLNCIFPPPRRPGKDGQIDPALLAKIDRMQRTISSLRLLVNEKDSQLREQRQSLRQPYSPAGTRADPISEREQEQSPRPHESLSTIVARPKSHASPNMSVSPANSATTQSTTDYTAGKLIRDEGRSIYVGGTFWVALNTQDQFNDLDNGDESETFDGEDFSVSQDSTIESVFSNFPLQSHAAAQSPTHPPIANRQKLWLTFTENVDPITKILHMPTVTAQIAGWLTSEDMTTVPKSLNALLFAIYFSAVSSLEEDVCRELLGCERDILATKYRIAEEHALTAAGFLNTDDLVVMQSLIIYLITLRHTAPRRSWTLCPLAFRLLQSFGAHRDGASLKLVTYESEMHKRLCWHLLMLECGAAEDSGCDPTLVEISSFTALPPLNLNDSDLSANMDVEPVEQTGWTDSTLLTMLAEICQLWRLSCDYRLCPEEASKPLSSMTETEKREFVRRVMSKFEDRYIKICSPLVPIQWVTATLSRFLVLEFKLASFKPLERHVDLTPDECEEFLNDALECLELTNKLLTDRRSSRWVWLFKTFTAWQALAFVLTELAVRPLQKGREKAWSTIEQTMVSRWSSPHDRRGHQWRSMLSLLALAQTARDRDLRRRRACLRGRKDVPLSATRPSLPLQQQSPLAEQVRQTQDSAYGSQPPMSLQGDSLGDAHQVPQMDASMWMNAMQPDSDMHPFGPVPDLDDMDVLEHLDFDCNSTDVTSSHPAFLQVAFEVQGSLTVDGMSS
ncbi:hypothetical protein V2G26_010839 [Clonostachys chloroleuca]